MRKIFTVLILLAAAVTASARHHNNHTQGEPGQFDFYLLSLSWSPAFCLTKPDAPECAAQKRYGFIVHGLWPQYERGWPQHCASNAQVSDTVVSSLTDVMPSRELIYHEWSTHGSCSGLDPEAYFGKVKQAFNSIAVPKEMQSPHQQIEQSPPIIASAFQGANPQLPARSVVVTCSRQTAPRLREVHVCLDRDLKPRQCSADALKEACRADSIIVPPIR
jgi:ribonuclease T2